MQWSLKCYTHLIKESIPVSFKKFKDVCLVKVSRLNWKFSTRIKTVGKVFNLQRLFKRCVFWPALSVASSTTYKNINYNIFMTIHLRLRNRGHDGTLAAWIWELTEIVNPPIKKYIFLKHFLSIFLNQPFEHTKLVKGTKPKLDRFLLATYDHLKGLI